MLTEHIETENEAFFDIAEMRLSDSQQLELAAEFAMVEKMNMGPDKCEEFNALLEELESRYLK